ncbi:MAG: hypothetical protein C4526_12025 [Nitrospiraceae bacterium]|nr:MAG: hypothetical protein C4526_12025 [Nitrospiraceae bacterium]
MSGRHCRKQGIEEADRLCDRIAIIVEGRIIFTNAPEALKRQSVMIHLLSADNGVDTATKMSYTPN